VQKRRRLPKSTDAVNSWYLNQCYLYESDIRKKSRRVCLLSSCSAMCQFCVWLACAHMCTHTKTSCVMSLHLQEAAANVEHTPQKCNKQQNKNIKYAKQLQK